MYKIILDFTDCKYLGSLHKILKESFGFPDYYGENLDALWDCLDNYCDYRLHVEIKGVQSLVKENREEMGKILKIFAKVHNSTPNITFEVIS